VSNTVGACSSGNSPFWKTLHRTPSVKSSLLIFLMGIVFYSIVWDRPNKLQEGESGEVRGRYISSEVLPQAPSPTITSFFLNGALNPSMAGVARPCLAVCGVWKECALC
jgi:hypothetical protein